VAVTLSTTFEPGVTVWLMGSAEIVGGMTPSFAIKASLRPALARVLEGPK
jgi:hypothetical protein